LPEHPAEDSPVAREVIDALNRVLKALWADHVTDALFLSVGKALIQHGPTSIKPRAWRELLAALEAHPEADDALRAALAQADNQFKKRRAAERRVAAESLSEVVAPVESEGD
jgi:predicted Zn-dependent protease